MPVVKPDAFARADVIDLEMGWPRHLAIGRLVALWRHAQDGNGSSQVRPSVLAAWSGVAPDELERFIDAACEIHFLERLPDGRIMIVGNEGEVQRIVAYRESKSRAGKASAEAKRIRREANGTNGCSTRVEHMPNNGSTNGQHIVNEIQPSSSSSSSASLNREAAGASPPPASAGQLLPPDPSDPPDRPAPSEDRLTPESLAAIWNAERDHLPECLKLSDARRKAARARIRECPDVEEWRTVIRKLAASPVWSNRAKGDWRPDFDFLLQTNTYAQVLEGKYDKAFTKGAGDGKPRVHRLPILEPLRGPT